MQAKAATAQIICTEFGRGGEVLEKSGAAHTSPFTVSPPDFHSVSIRYKINKRVSG